MTQQNSSGTASAPQKRQAADRKMWYREMVNPAVVLFLVGLIVTGLLAVVYQMAQPIIVEREAKEKMASLQTVLPAADTFEPEKSRSILEQGGLTVPETVVSLYPGMKGGAFAGCAVQVAPKGYGGAISMIVGVGADGAISGVIIISQNETPGLGTKAAEPAFLKQYNAVADPAGLQVVKRVATTRGEIEALTGATVTSRAVTRGVTDALTAAREFMKKEGLQ